MSSFMNTTSLIRGSPCAFGLVSRRRRAMAVAAMLALCWGVTANCEERGTGEEAQALVKLAIEYQKLHGRSKALWEANKESGLFRVKDLYVFAYDGNGVSLAHPNVKFPGKNLIDLRDARGVYINREFIKTASTPKGHGWVTYYWPHAVTKIMEPKRSYVEKYQDVYWVCGYYLGKSEPLKK